MVLSDEEIARELAYHGLVVEPVDLDEQLQPCSLDIRLGNDFSSYATSENVVFDAKHSDMETYTANEYVSDEEGIVIGPDDFYLANTKESMVIPDYLSAELKGRSSLGRMGIEVHSTAGWIDSGFGSPSGADLVLEISNNTNNPIKLYPGERVGQLVFHRLDTPSKTPYNEKEDQKYNSQKGAVGSRIYEDNHE